MLSMRTVKNSFGVEYVRYTNEEVVAGRNDKGFVNELIKNARGFILDVIRTVYLDSSYSREDKLQLGYEGFMNAIKKFDSHNGVDFYTYAYASVQGVLYNESKKAKCAKRGYNKDENKAAVMVSLDAPQEGEEGEGQSKGDTIEDESVNVEREVLNTEADLVKTLAKVTGEKAAAMIVLNVLHEKTCEEIAAAYGVSKMAVSKNIRKGYEKIKERYTEAEFADIIGLR